MADGAEAASAARAMRLAAHNAMMERRHSIDVEKMGSGSRLPSLKGRGIILRDKSDKRDKRSRRSSEVDFSLVFDAAASGAPPPPSAALSGAKSSDGNRKSWWSSKWPLIIGVCMLIVCGGATGAYFALTSSSSPAPAPSPAPRPPPPTAEDDAPATDISPPPSLRPPPPTPAPPGTTLLGQSVVSSSFVAQGSIDDFTAARIDAIAQVIAAAAGVNANAVTIALEGASVRLSIDILASNAASADAIVTRLSGAGADGIFASVTTLNTALTAAGVSGVTVEQIDESPTAFVRVVPAPSPPSIPPPSPPSPPPPLVLNYDFPATVGPGLVLLPASESGVLITLTLAGPSGGASPVARSYDGHAWEELFAHPLPIRRHGANGEPSEIELPIAQAGSYRLDYYNVSQRTGSAEGVHYSRAERQAARLLTQASFGPTRADVYNATLAREDAQGAAEQWVQEQMSLPATSHRSHYRRRVSPRLTPSQDNAFMEIQPACAPGSRWHRFAFTKADEQKTLEVERLPGWLPDAGYRLRVDGEVRTEARYTGAGANWTSVTSGRCVGLLAYVSSIEECTRAALALGFRWDGTYSTYSSSPSAVDDLRGVPPLTFAQRGPRGCYLEGKPPIPDATGNRWTNYLTLRFNVNDTNTGSCSVSDVCICKRVTSNTEDASLAAPSAPPAPPPTPPPPFLPGTVANVTDPRECPPHLCCFVLYKNEQGVNCDPVPIW